MLKTFSQKLVKARLLPNAGGGFLFPEEIKTPPQRLVNWVIYLALVKSKIPYLGGQLQVEEADFLYPHRRRTSEIRLSPCFSKNFYSFQWCLANNKFW